MLFSHPNVESSIVCEGCCFRVISGEACCAVKYTNAGESDAFIGLTPNFPAKVIPVEMSWVNGKLLSKEGAYMAHMGDDVSVGIDLDCNCMTCCCGGQGCVRQNITGSGTVFLNAGGTIVQKSLYEGETLLLDTEALVAWSADMEFGIKTTGNCMTMCCGGEGMFNTAITGPGLGIVQSMSFEQYKAAVAPPMPAPRGGGGGGGDGGDGVDIGGD